MIKTPWFPAYVKPAHPGVYETQTQVEASTGTDDACGGPYFNHWDGFWGMSAIDAEWAASDCNKTEETHNPIFRWRGLAEQPQ